MTYFNLYQFYASLHSQFSFPFYLKQIFNPLSCDALNWGKSETIITRLNLILFFSIDKKQKI
jgi:hypothetical protein